MSSEGSYQGGSDEPSYGSGDANDKLRRTTRESCKTINLENCKLQPNVKLTEILAESFVQESCEKGISGNEAVKICSFVPIQE